VKVVHARCAGLDISKKDAKVCVRILRPCASHDSTRLSGGWRAGHNRVLESVADRVAAAAAPA
jgi:hypothetical protein